MQRLDSVDLDQLASSQGIHGFSLLASARTIPVCHQFISMLIKPFAHEPHSPTGQRAGEHVAGLDHDQCLVSGIARVEMRRWMIDEIHPNHDPIELADPRHKVIVSKPPDKATRPAGVPQ